jgi:hypothetical protein
MFKTLSCIYQTVQKKLHWFFFFPIWVVLRGVYFYWHSSDQSALKQSASCRIQRGFRCCFSLILATPETYCHSESSMKWFGCQVIWCGGRFTSLILFKEYVSKSVPFGVWAGQWVCVAGNITCWIIAKLCKTHDEYFTPWSRVLFEKLTGLQLVKKFSAFYPFGFGIWHLNFSTPCM